MTDKDKRTKTEPSKGEINKILHNFKTEIEEVEKYIQSSFNDVEIMTTLQKEEKEKIKDIYSVQLNSLNFPFELNLDISFQHFYDSGVLKSFESKILQELFPKVFFSKRSKKMCRLLFLIVFILKFPKCILDEGSGLLATIRKNISKCYVKVFAELPKLKEELINLLIFSISYITHMSFYILFPRNQIQFKIRFILDVYHIAIFELNGICVSDYYLQNIFEKIFTSKFLDYEQQQNNSLDIKQEKLSAKNNERNFLGKKLIYPTIFKYEGGVDFADELMNRLKINKRSPRRYGLTTNNNKYSNDGKSNDLEEGTDNKRFKDETKKTSDTLSNHIFQSDKIKEREDSKKIFIANMNTKKKFNCIQISPAMSQVLEINNMNLPFNKKKLINHSMDKLYTQNLDYKEMFDDINNQRRNVKEAKKHNGRPKSISQKSITNNYGHMKVDYDEKAKKYPKLFCDMEDLYHILNKYDERFTTLASSKKTLSDYNKHNVLKFEEIKKEAEDEIKKRENQREGKKLLIENEKTKLLKNLEKEEEENKKKKGESAKQNEHENKNKEEEEVVELNNPRKSISTFFQLPQLVNKFSQNMTASKKNFQKSRQKNMSDSTAASLFKAEEEEEQVMDYSTLRKKINLNAVIEEGGQINHISDEEEKDSNQHNEKDLFLDKRREYFVKYSKMIKGNHDENIDELISKIMLKQNMLSRKLIAGFNNKKKLGNHKLSKPALSVGSIGTLTLDLIINNNNFTRIAYFKTVSLQPTVGRIPDVLKSEENALALPAEIYYNATSKIAILQIRSQIKESGMKVFLHDLDKFFEVHSFESINVIGSLSCKSKPDFEITSLIPNVYYLVNEQYKENFLDIAKLIDLGKFNLRYEEKVADLIVGGGIMLKLHKKKEFKKYPILFLMIYSVPGEDTNGAIAMCKVLSDLCKKKEIRPFSKENYILPKYFLN